MRFWDSSAIVQLYLEQGLQKSVRRLYVEDEDVVIWWATPVECISAFIRHQREGGLSENGVNSVIRRFSAHSRRWDQILPVGALREEAERLLRRHVLRAADSLQLAAAWLAANQKPDSLEFVCLDQKLNRVAEKEGYRVVAPASSDVP
ncbi:MAG: type II toxin-antitoxin system VapC family toxin [Betaproteobacteria bacterium]|nr:type II toxin-antitoxin system VapC family toxin [Betaproteobacteria bacterium]